MGSQKVAPSKYQAADEPATEGKKSSFLQKMGRGKGESGSTKKKKVDTSEVTQMGARIN